LRCCTSRSSSFVGIPSSRAASVALKGSVAIGVPFVVEAEFTAERSDLALDTHHNGEPAGIDQSVPRILEISEQA
jgi:hypothetical protein